MVSAVMATVQSGSYISPWKALTILLILLIWARLLTWIDKDAPIARLHRSGINAGMFSGLLLGYLLFFTLPGFLLALGALFLCFAADIGTYLGIRAKVVGLSDLKGQFQNWVRSFFTKEKAVEAVAGRVLIVDKSGNPMAPPAGETPERVGYDAVQALLTDPLHKGAERVDLIPGETAISSYLVDGVKYDGPVLSRHNAGAAVQHLKQAAGLDINEKRKPMAGSFKTVLDNDRHDWQIQVAGNAAGETMRLTADPKKRFDFKVEALGFSPDQLETTKKNMLEGGIVLVSAPKAQGLTTMLYTLIRSHDAFMYHIQTIERHSEMDLEGITQSKMPSTTTAAEEAAKVSWVVSQEPDAIMVNSLQDPSSAATLIKFANSKRRVYIGMRASSTFDALKQWRKLVGDDALAVKNLRMIINGRVVRRLCTACKIGYAPDPSQLRKLNMNPDQVGTLFQARKTPLRDGKGRIVPCTFCRDMAFKGRIGVYEMFVIDDDTRAAVESGGADNQLKMVFRKQRGKYLQEQALAQVQAGETSVEEVLRVLKGDSQPVPSNPGTPAPV